MKINVNPVTNRDMLQRYTPDRARLSNTGAAPSESDRVALSDEALSFSKVIARARESIETRSEDELARVREVGDAVRSGAYRVDSSEIAESIVSGVWL
ncbi:MAG: flagellar biosynthesis anti-sigma factor FlgM [Oscillospiraceae bacterium]|nr:flagellar biosynthesis anti-sigma factor FlgM [Oscillospiraceae bacterium]